MSTPNPAPVPLMAKIAEQKVRLPQMYGRIDFTRMPERYTEADGVDTALRAELAPRRAQLLANREVVDTVRAYTMLGDQVADAYAALIPEHGFRKLVEMLVAACDKGVEAVDGAPPELAAFIAEMEAVPRWIDMRMVEEGARLSRNALAHLSPLILRGAFFATFTNKYSALPMAITGALSTETAARRVRETATFFTVTAMPGALARHGAGFKAAAMVRLMHSMVRFHVLTRGNDWDPAVFGVPIPQVDQMPAGLIAPFLAAQRTLAKGRSAFSEQDRAQTELARYRCHLLGLPEALLPDTPQAMVDVMLTRHATLRRAFDDATCGALLRATMAADLARPGSLFERFRSRAEPSAAKVFFVRNYLSGDKERAARMGVTLRAGDYRWSAAALAAAAVQMTGYGLASRLPGLRGRADRALVSKLGRLLASYGHAQFTTDAAGYRPGHAGPA